MYRSKLYILILVLILYNINFNRPIIKEFSINFMKNLKMIFYKIRINKWNKNRIQYIIIIILIILLINYLSIYPYNFPYTRQIRIILRVSLRSWIIITLFSLIKNKKFYLSHIIPEGRPIILSVILFIIEIVRNIIRPITLFIRLISNILSGHILIILLRRVVIKISYLRIIIYVALNIVEIGVSIIQSYILGTLILLYYSEK